MRLGGGLGSRQSCYGRHQRLFVIKKLCPSGGVIGGAHGLAAETMLETSEPTKFLAA